MKQNDSFAEPRFPVRSYGKGELAMYYLPGIAQQTAVNRLNEWIRTAPGLEQRLLATGMNPYCRRGRKINCVMRRFFPSSSVGDRPAPRGCTSTPDERKVTTI